MKKEDILGAIAGGVLGVIVWFPKGPYDSFGIGPLIFIAVMAWGWSLYFWSVHQITDVFE